MHQLLVTFIDGLYSSSILDGPLGYIDPGAGSQLLQWLAAGLLSGRYVLKISWTHFKAKIRQSTEKDR